ncbi:MAG TPA: trehalose-6-phosphate synthase [Gemmatimonadales bacterium]|nr:trehalose-6-phosphate synthase [Gemmatimonadales bacterium]
MDDLLRDRTLIMLSNREPYEHTRRAGGVSVRQPPGGLVSALDPTMRRTNGTWVAWGSGSADRETSDANGRILVPEDEESYTLRRVWLNDADVEGYYLGFANGVLWPACHMLIQHIVVRDDHWMRYRDVNERFANAVLDEVRRADREPMVWIQDYHFALVSDRLRKAIPSLFIHQFWHIPFPPLDILGVLPGDVAEELMCGMLGNDLLEFHTRRFVMNFLSCVEYFVPGAVVRRSTLTVEYEGRVISLGVFPISIDVDLYEKLASSPAAGERVRELRQRYAPDGRQALGVSVDRLDYTKGIPERLRALATLWEEDVVLRERFTVILVATPSRTDLAAYRDLEAEVVSAVHDINERFGTDEWTPIVLIHDNVSAELLATIYRAADLCMVSSLQDGMNLVAKEFVACQVDERGVLVLSRFTGAAEGIDGAVLINPFNVDGFVAGIRTALEMQPEERRTRMRAMREQLRQTTIFDWLSAILERADALMREGRTIEERESAEVGGDASA